MYHFFEVAASNEKCRKERLTYQAGLHELYRHFVVQTKLFPEEKEEKIKR